MNDQIFSDIEIEKTCEEQFNRSVDIVEVIARGVTTGIASQATLFKAADKQIYLYITSQSAQVLDDVQKIVQRMNLEADYFFPPHGEDEYFERIAREKFKAMFPGKYITGDDDLRYYKNLAMYNPALVRIAKVKGEVRTYEREGKTWRKIADYSYSKIKPS
ncbi:MAG: hypothetical protein ACREGJ_01145 [Candidatus Saccharimonadales bacterium]